MGGDGGKATLDDISRRHKLSYEIKIVEIRRFVVASELSKCFFPSRMFGGELFFRFHSKMDDGEGHMILDDISRRHNLSYEIKNYRNPSVGCDWRTV
ncbi:hypothetical protein AVEN_52182-1 [Araneus ventricosus]|uniref:Uncharacterized protein n=1 Tax=Araneus ventricosus TaxID=182803 RepID=A0A4Y2QVR2_ARAVE|nr:hypothetical protein AVEN_52182-1 [Araneus ventricosus]